MKTFDVYSHPTLGYAAVKRGFSWPGFFFTGFWALTKKMWVGGTVLVIAILLLVGAQSDAEALGDMGTHEVLLLLQFALCVVVGIRGNERWGASLRSRGFTLVGEVVADEPDGAIATLAQKRAPVV